MKITLAPFGPSNDVLPMIALAKTLQARGHIVTICAPEEFRSRIYNAEIPMVTSGPTYRRYLECEQNVEDATSDLVVKLNQDMATHFVALRDAAREADVLIGSRLQIAGPSLAEQRKIPYFYAVTTPGNADIDSFPIFGVAHDRVQKRRNKRIKEWDRHVLTALNRERQFGHLGPVSNLFDHVYRSGKVLTVVDPAFRSTRSLPNQIETGFWFLDDEIDLEPETMEYLNEGAAPVYIAPFRYKDRAMVLSLCSSLVSAGHRVVLGHGWDEIKDNEIPTGCQRITSLSYAQIFQKMGVIVHSGVPDIAMHAVRSKVPQVIVPYTAEQFYWAEKCEAVAAAKRADALSVQQVITSVLSGVLSPDRFPEPASDGKEKAAEAIENA